MPIGHGNRVVKPRSAKQRVQSKAYSQSKGEIRPASAGLPASSWWIGLSRAELDAKAEEQRARMASSVFGASKLGGGTVG